MKSRFALALLAVALSGCEKKPKALGYEPCNAEGVVTIDGKPLPNGMVTFVPQIAESAGGHPGIASVNAAGAYKLGNAENGRYKSLRPGEYVVMVVAMDLDRGHGKPSPKLSVPAKYADALESPLRATLKPGENKVDFSLMR
jgi:hypothetical protein